MQKKTKTRPKLPRAKVLTAVDLGYDRLSIAQNDDEFMEALSKLFGEIGSLLKIATPTWKAGAMSDIKADVAQRMFAYNKLRRWNSAPNAVQIKSDTGEVSRWPVPPALMPEVCEALEAILGKPESWTTKFE